MGWKSFFRLPGHRTLENKLKRAREKAIAAGEVGIGANTRVVPQLTIGSQGVAANGYVQANTGNTANARSRVFEQNFIKRIQSMVFGSLGMAGLNSQGTKLNLAAYYRKLNNAASEAEAILYYDELIAILPIIMVYTILRARLLYSRKGRNGNVSSDTNMHKVISAELSFEEEKQLQASVRYFILNTGIIAGAATATALTGGLGLAVFVPVLIGSIVLMFTAPIATIAGNSAAARYRRNERASSLDSIIVDVCVNLFAEREYMFEALIPKLKFWGLNQEHLDILVNTAREEDGFKELWKEIDSNGDKVKIRKFIQSFVEASTKPDIPLAPNDPFPEEVRTVEIQMNNFNKPIYNSYRNTANFGKTMRNTTAPNYNASVTLRNPTATGGRRNRTRRNRTRSTTRRR